MILVKIMKKSKNAHSSFSKICPNCCSSQIDIFYELLDVPINSVLLLKSQEEAINFPRGDIVLGFCKSCGFIFNLAFNSDLLEYSNRYEATQGFSSTFNAFHRDLAKRLVDQYDLHDKDIIEIGCGQGEFLTLLCDIGNNRGVGFDPVYNDKRNEKRLGGPITFIKDFYSEKYSSVPGDFVCCKMTLEHIQETAKFVGMISNILHNKPNTTVFFQVPDITRILHEVAFWDIYYEHCSYFSLGSLSRLFRRNGFDVVNLGKDYDDQYLLITAKPGSGENLVLEKENDLLDLSHAVANFVRHYELKLAGWREKINDFKQAKKRVVVWGASSKAVAFLTSLEITKEIKYAVDINPHKAGTYIAGTGQKIVTPEFLREYVPDYVIIMNPIYQPEIRSLLLDLKITSELLVV